MYAVEAVPTKTNSRLIRLCHGLGCLGVIVLAFSDIERSIGNDI